MDRLHDHGVGYTVYGCLYGNKTIPYYERVDGGPQEPTTAELRQVKSFELFSGAPLGI